MHRNRWSGSNGFSGRDGPDYAGITAFEAIRKTLDGETLFATG